MIAFLISLALTAADSPPRLPPDAAKPAAEFASCELSLDAVYDRSVSPDVCARLYAIYEPGVPLEREPLIAALTELLGMRLTPYEAAVIHELRAGAHGFGHDQYSYRIADYRFALELFIGVAEENPDVLRRPATVSHLMLNSYNADGAESTLPWVTLFQEVAPLNSWSLHQAYLVAFTLGEADETAFRDLRSKVIAEAPCSENHLRALLAGNQRMGWDIRDERFEIMSIMHECGLFTDSVELIRFASELDWHDQRDRALRVLSSALNTGQVERTTYNLERLGNLAWRTENWDLMIETERVLVAVLGDANHHILLATALWWANELDEAEVHARYATTIEGAETSYRAYNVLSGILESRGDSIAAAAARDQRDLFPPVGTTLENAIVPVSAPHLPRSSPADHCPALIAEARLIEHAASEIGTSINYGFVLPAWCADLFSPEGDPLRSPQ